MAARRTAGGGPARPAGGGRTEDVAVRYDPPPEEVRLGVVVPFDFELDREYWGYVPSNVSLAFSRTPHLALRVGVGLARAVGRPGVVAAATRALSALEPAATLYACTSGSFVGGPAGDQEIREAMEAAGGGRAVTSSWALLQALRACEARSVAVATPYTRRLTLRLVAFLEEAGYGVVSSRSLGLAEDIARVSPETVADLARAAAHPDADVVFVSCTNLRTHGIVADLERAAGGPVLTANQVSLWAALWAAGALGPGARAAGAMGADAGARSTGLLLRAAAERKAPAA